MLIRRAKASENLRGSFTTLNTTANESKANRILGTQLGTTVTPMESKANKILGTRFETTNEPASNESIKRFLQLIIETPTTSSPTGLTCHKFFTILDTWAITADTIIKAPSNGATIGDLLAAAASKTEISLWNLGQWLQKLTDLAKERMEEEFDSEERLRCAVTWVLLKNISRAVRGGEQVVEWYGGERAK